MRIARNSPRSAYLPEAPSIRAALFITSGRGRSVADTFDDVHDDTTPGLGANALMNIAHA